MPKFYDLTLNPHWMNKNFDNGRTAKIREIVLHHNAGHGIDPWLTWQTREASAHFQVWGSGKIDYLVNVLNTAWHAHEANPYSIGIEHENLSGAPNWPIASKGLEASAKLVGYLCYKYKLGVPKLGVNVTTHHAIETDGIGSDTGTACPGPYFLEQLNNPVSGYWITARAAYNRAVAIHRPLPVKPKPPVITKKFSRGISAATMCMVLSAEGHTVKYSRLRNRLTIDGTVNYNYKQFMAAMHQALIAANCTTAARVSMFLAQVGAESGSFRWMEELASGEAYEGRANLGNTRRGDGVRFKGRGPLQITGRANYAALSAWAYSHGWVPTKTFFVDHPEQLATIHYGLLGAVWYWTVARNMNAYADRGDILGATKAVNGGTNNLKGRTTRWNLCLSQGNKLLPRGVRIPTAKPVSHTRVVTVQRGQTLSTIAFANGTTWQKLQQLNNLKNPNQIYVGQKLRVN